MAKPEFIYGNSFEDVVKKAKLDPNGSSPLFCLSTNNLFFGFEGKSFSNTTHVERVYCYPTQSIRDEDSREKTVKYKTKKSSKSVPKKQSTKKNFRAKKVKVQRWTPLK